MRMSSYTTGLGLSTLAALSLAAPSTVQAQTTTYTSQAAFEAAVGTGMAAAYTETFTGGAGLATSDSFSANGFGYTVTSPGPQDNQVYRDGDIIGPNFNNSTLIFTFNTPNVTAIGGNFFVEGINGNVIPGDVTLTLNDGTSTTFSSTSPSDFRGFVSKTPILSLSFPPPEPTVPSYATVDNFTVGAAAVPQSAVPEPGSLALLGLGGLSLTARWRPRAAKKHIPDSVR